MGRFRDNDGRSGFRGNREGGFSGSRGGNGGFRGRPNSGGFGGRGRSFGDSDGRPQMHEATCSKCGRTCQVPFRPTGSKPVFCSDCFRQQGDSGSNNFVPRREGNGGGNAAQGGMSQEQFKQLNMKLDKILAAMQELELEVIEGEDAEDIDADEDEDDDEEA